jgi:membrane associated rhomboid family serine protease
MKENELDGDSAYRTRMRFAQSVRLPLYFLVVVWLVHVYQNWTGFSLGMMGIRPRNFLGLRGVFFAPFLHEDWQHLISNTLPFLATTTLLFYFYERVAFRAFFMLYFLSGLVIWMFSENEGHFVIGLSYIVYGVVSFVFWMGIFRRSPRAILLSLLVLLFYSGMFAGILPTKDIIERHISWEGHLFGALVGIFAAYYYKDELEVEELSRLKSKSGGEAKVHFFERDVFQKTLFERAEEKRRAEIEEQNRKFLPPDFFGGGWYSSNTNEF